MKKLFLLAATLAMAVFAASPAMAQSSVVDEQYGGGEPEGGSGESVSATGVVEPLGPTTFMYGTHDLAGSGYVMESGNLDLSEYEGETVTVYGTLAIGEGEIENGPPMISVESVEATGGDSPEDPGEAVVLSGEISPIGATTFMYGTHSVVNDADGASYALQSDSVALADFEGTHATITGSLVPGYESGQVEGGPSLVEVTNVEPSESEGAGEVSGVVLDVGEDSVLVEDANGGQYVFDITENTGFVDGVIYIPENTPPRAPNATDLAPGLEVSVVPTGPVAQSFPAQGEAATITFLSPWYEGDDDGEAVEKTLAGTITSVGDGSIVVSEDPNLGVEDPGYCAQAINFFVTENTEILAENGDPASAEDFAEGRAVEVSYTEVPGAPETAICPPQREADTVVILDGSNEDPTDPPNDGGDGNDSGGNGNGSGGNGSDGNRPGGVAEILGVSTLPDTGGAYIPALGIGAALLAGGLLVRRMSR